MLRRFASRLLFYSAAAVVATWPLAIHPRSMLAAIGGPGDPLLNLWILGWDLSVIQNHPRWLFDGRIFDANIFHPAERTLAYSDHLIPQALAMWPAYAITRDPVVCYNLLFFASLVASGMAMDAFARRVTGTTWGPLLAGLAWTIAPFRFAHYIHLQLQGLYVLPLAFLALHRFVARRTLRDAAVLGAALAFQAWTSVYFGVIGGVGVIVSAIVLIIAVGRGHDGRVWARLGAAVLVAAVLVAPIAWVYSSVQREAGFGRSLFEASNSAARVDSYIRAPVVNRLYGDAGVVPITRPNAQATPAGPERQLFPGLLVVGLAVAGAFAAGRSDRRPVVMALIAVGIAGFVLSLGPDGVRPLYALVHRFVFGFQAIRASARFAVLVHFALVVLAAFGVETLVRRARTEPARRVVAGALIACALLEWSNRGDAYMPAPARTTAVGEWLKHAPQPGAVVYVPLARDVENTPLMVQSLEHLRPIVNGYSGQVPPFHSAVMTALATFPDAEALGALRDLEVRFVVAREPVNGTPVSVPSPLVERARVDGSVIYELRWTPETEALLMPREAAPPPEPGPMPFSEGETATYAVFWTSGIADAEAGRAVISAERRGEGYELSLEAQTAPWVARFFEARDRFETTATRRLLPRVHRRMIREGRRSIDRTFEYDLDRGTVKMDDLTLAVAPDARDPLGAFFYLRTLPWRELPSARIPVNDAGKNLVLAVKVAGEETVSFSGQTAPALRLECTIEQRIQRRRPIAFTVWLGVDQRRMPLAASMDAGFGRFRLELVTP